VDGHGRELFAETSLCLNLMDWVTAQKPATDTITATLVADFSCVPTSLCRRWPIRATSRASTTTTRACWRPCG